MLPPFALEFTKAQINQINRAHKTGGQLVIKPTRKQIEGGFLGTLASMFGSGLQVDRGATSNTKNVYVPPPPTHGEGYTPVPYQPPPFFGTWENPIGMGVVAKGGFAKKKKSKGKGLLLGKNSPFNSIPILGTIL